MNPDEQATATMNEWLTEKSLAGLSEAEMVGGLCEHLSQAGMPLARAVVLVDTLHPIHEGRAFRWSRATHQPETLEYGRTREGAGAEAWRRSPLYYMLETNQSVLRRRLTEPAPESMP